MTQDFLIALLFGAVVIIVFARDQFQRPSYRKSQELERLIEFLEPPDLRNGRVYWFASAVYTGILLTIYLLLCVYGTVPILQTLGFAGIENSDTILVPAVPLGVSLAVVGLAPGMPILQRFEEKIRFAAHHLSGIPAWLLHGCHILQNRPIGLPTQGPGLLIPEQDWERLAHYRSYGAVMLDDPDDFAENITKIVAYRTWILKKRMNVTRRAPREAILRKEEDMQERVERMILGLDSLSGFHSQTLPEPPDDVSRASWASLAQEVDELCARICGLLMLQVEHGLISTDPGEAIEDPDGDADVAPRDAAQALLGSFLSGAEILGRETALVGHLWGRATAVAVIVVFLYALALRTFWDFWYPNEGVVVLTFALKYALSAALLYAPAIFVALALHGRRLWIDDKRERWPSMVGADWTRCMWPVTQVFLATMAAALIPIVAFNLYGSFAYDEIAFSFKQISELFWPGLKTAFITELPRATLAPILALGVVASVDAWRANSGGAKNYNRPVLICTVVLMALWTPIVTLLAEQWLYSLGCGEAATCRVPALGTLFMEKRLDLALGAVRSALIGFCVLYVCQKALTRGTVDATIVGTRSLERSPTQGGEERGPNPA